MQDITKLPTNAAKRELIQKAINTLQLRLTWIVDALIPGDDDIGLPSASACGVVTKYLTVALVRRDDYAQQFLDIVEGLPNQRPDKPLEFLRQRVTGDDWHNLTRVVAGAYFYDPGVNATLGYHGQETIREEPDYEYIMDAIAIVQARGPIYVATPRSE